MGLLSHLFGDFKQLPVVTSILPNAAKQEILSGRLPVLNQNTVFTKSGEKVHYIDKALHVGVKVVKTYKHVGMSAPGLIKGVRVNVGKGMPEEHRENTFTPGVLYITNQRVIFQAKQNGFDKAYRYLTAIVPFSNGIELQFGQKTYSLLVADGNVAYQTLQLIKQKRGI